MDHRQLIVCIFLLLGYISSGINGQMVGMGQLTSGKLVTPGDTNLLWPTPGSESMYGGGNVLGALTGLGQTGYPTGTYSATPVGYQGSFGGAYPGTMGGTYSQVSNFGGQRPPYPYSNTGYQPGAYPQSTQYQQPGMYPQSGQQQQPYYQQGYNPSYTPGSSMPFTY